jgi:hypothetical protein
VEPDRALAASHLIVYVADTDATVAFWCKGLGGVRLHTIEPLDVRADNARKPMRTAGIDGLSTTPTESASR